MPAPYGHHFCTEKAWLARNADVTSFVGIVAGGATRQHRRRALDGWRNITSPYRSRAFTLKPLCLIIAGLGNQARRCAAAPDCRARDDLALPSARRRRDIDVLITQTDYGRRRLAEQCHAC